MPVSSVSGMKIVATTVSTFITSFSRLLTFDEVRVEHPGDPVLEDQRIVGDAHQVVVDVAEAERHLGADVDEVAPRQPGDDVALRRDDAAQRARPRASPSRIRRTSAGSASRRSRSRARRAGPRACPPPAGSDRPSRRRCGGTARPALRPASSGCAWHVLAQLGDRRASGRRGRSRGSSGRGRSRRRASRSRARPSWKSMPCRTMYR